MKKVINLTTREIKIIDRKSRRLLSTYSPGVGELVFSPEPKDGILYIVTKDIAALEPERLDLLFVTYPDDLVYDSVGKPLGYFCFSTMENIV